MACRSTRISSISRANNISLKNVDSVCQCCLSFSDLRKMVDDNKFESNVRNYYDMMEYSFSIQMNNLSKCLWICSECISKLRSACRFRKQIEKSQSVIWECINLESRDRVCGLDETIQATISTKVDSESCENMKLEYAENDFHSTHSVTSEKQEKFDENEILMTLDESEGVLIVTSTLKSEGLEDDPGLFIKTEESNEADIGPQKHRKLSSKKTKKGVRLKTISKKRKANRKKDEDWSEVENDFSKTGPRKDMLPFKVEKQLNNRKCELCGQSFVCFKDLQNHMHEHFPDHVCHICGKFYATQTTLNSHMERVHAPPKFKCPECGKHYRNRYSIKCHIMTVHRGQKVVTNFKCSNCNESFPTYYRRVVHMVEKHGFEPYKCQECGKSFINCGTLRTHVRKDHRMERKFQCEMCAKSFFSNKDLAKHMVCHTGEKIFHCGICLKSYARKKTLIEHMKSHNPVKAHICSVCGRGFTQKCTMNVHMRTHDKEKCAVPR